MIAVSYPYLFNTSASVISAGGTPCLWACHSEGNEGFALTTNSPVSTIQRPEMYSTQFVAGVNDFGVTQVQVFQADTVMQTLPIDTLFNISIDRRWFVEVTPVGTAQVSVEARVDVDDRNQLRETGAILAADPWRFAYLFNQAVTRTIDIVL